MKIHSAEHTFYYIDPSLVTGGNGSTVATAAKDFPSTLTENTIYLIRRTTFIKLDDGNTYATIPNGTHTIKSVVIMGMPKETDEEYKYIPEDVKNAWGNDTYDYANVRVYRNNSTVTFSECLNFNMTRVMFLVANSDSSTYFINFHQSPNVNIQHCYFRNFDWTINGATTDCYNSDCPSRFLNFEKSDYRLSKYGYFFKMNDCIIENVGDGHGITAYSYHQIDLSNIIIYSGQTSSNNFAIHFEQNYKGSLTNINNIQILQHFSNNGNYLKGGIYISNANYAEVKNINAQKGNLNSLASYKNYAAVNPIIELSVVGSGIVAESITVNYPFVRILKNSLIKFTQKNNGDGNQHNIVPESSQYARIQNINITTASDNVNVKNESVSEDQNIFKNSSDCGALYLNYINESSINSLNSNVSNAFLLQGLRLNCKAGVALYARHAIIDMSGVNDIIYGCVNLGSCTGQIKKIDSWMTGYIIKDNGNNFLFIEEIVSNRNNPLYTYNANPALETKWASNILCNKCNIKFCPEIYYSDDNENNECNYVVTSEVTEGNYVVRNRLAKAQTWSTRRVESNTGCSLKLTNESADDSRFALRLGGEPFQGIQIDVPAGEKTLKVYCTTFGYNNPLEIANNHLLCKVTLPDGQVIFSNNGNWSEDSTSTWEDVDNNTSFVFELPINSTEAGIGYIEYFFNWFQKEAITYLDPFPEIV